MSDTIISVENLGKKYVLSHQGERGGYSRFSERLEDWVKRPFNLGKRLLRGDGRSKIGDGGVDGHPSSISHLPSTASKEEFWALKDVSFEVKRGEVVGIIGRNGAGKSTLLKILSRITEPTEGRVTLRGRVASLLEVGTGFHPELTGRENIFLNGAILGMTKAEIRKKFDEIVAFAEVERFLDTPVKRYSSGMYVRLAFAVAAHLEPEILVVDEVLAVGDAEFQKKCLGKMKDVATGGRTVIFVSHNMHAVRRLCSSGIFLQSGKLIQKGELDPIIQMYEGSFQNQKKTEGQYDLYQSPQLVLHRLQVENPQTKLPVARTGEPLEIKIYLTVLKPCVLKTIAVKFYDMSGTRLVNVESLRLGNQIALNKKGPVEIIFKIHAFPLLEGFYETALWAVDSVDEIKIHIRNLTNLEVVEPPKNKSEIKPSFDGCVQCNFNLAINE